MLSIVHHRGLIIIVGALVLALLGLWGVGSRPIEWCKSTSSC